MLTSREANELLKGLAVKAGPGDAAFDVLTKAVGEITQRLIALEGAMKGAADSLQRLAAVARCNNDDHDWGGTVQVFGVPMIACVRPYRPAMAAMSVVGSSTKPCTPQSATSSMNSV